MGVWARHRRFAHNVAQRNDPKTPPLISPRCGASGVALGVPRDVPDERGVLGRGSGARQDSPARLSHNARFASHAGPSGHVGSRRADVFGSRVGAFMPDGGDPFSGWLAGVPENGADCDSKPVLCEGYGLHSLCHAGAELVNVVAVNGARGRVLPTCAGRVRRGPSPGGRRAGVRPAACPERQRSD
jgi:hypothetical protein